MHIEAIVDGVSFTSDTMIGVLGLANRFIAESRQAGKPVSSGTIHSSGALVFVLKNEHWVKP